MPWTPADAEGHTKAADTAAKRKRWAEIANDALRRCLEDGGEQDACEASAIKQANSVIAKQQEAGVAEQRGQGQGVGGDRQGDGGADRCVCPECGHEVEHERGTPCAERKCPECGAAMVGAAEQEESMPDENELEEAVTKTVDGKSYPAGDFLVVEDASKPSTWHLQVKRNGKPDHGLMGGAKAALTSEGGHRGNRYEGPGKQEAITKLKALYKAEDMPWGEMAAERIQVLEAALAWFREDEAERDRGQMRALGVAFVQMGVELITAAQEEPPAQEAEPEPETEPVVEDEEPSDGDRDEVQLAETATGHVMALAEATPALPDGVVPLHLDVVLIQPGFGNSKHKHYYPRDVLERDAKVFDGAKMYETDHRPEDKSTRTWVSTVTGIDRFTEDGAPVARVSVHDRHFAERLLALQADNLLDRMECSILAQGTARKGEVDGQKANIVEAITRADSVDWVTRAGAGGRALALAEADADSSGASADADAGDAAEPPEADPEPVAERETPAPEPVTLMEEETPEPEPVERLDTATVEAALAQTNLPDASRARLAEREYPTAGALQEAIQGEIAYVKALTGAGKPFGQGGTAARPEAALSLEEREQRKKDNFNRIMREIGAREV